MHRYGYKKYVWYYCVRWTHVTAVSPPSFRLFRRLFHSPNATQTGRKYICMYVPIKWVHGNIRSRNDLLRVIGVIATLLLYFRLPRRCRRFRFFFYRVSYKWALYFNYIAELPNNLTFETCRGIPAGLLNFCVTKQKSAHLIETHWNAKICSAGKPLTNKNKAMPQQ